MNASIKEDEVSPTCFATEWFKLRGYSVNLKIIFLVNSWIALTDNSGSLRYKCFFVISGEQTTTKQYCMKLFDQRWKSCAFYSLNFININDNKNINNLGIFQAFSDRFLVFVQEIRVL